MAHSVDSLVDVILMPMVFAIGCLYPALRTRAPRLARFGTHVDLLVLPVVILLFRIVLCKYVSLDASVTQEKC